MADVDNGAASDDAPPGGFAAKSAVSMVGRLLIVPANFLAGVIIARWLGPQGKGAYALVSAAATMVAAVAAAGIPMAATFFIGRYRWPPVGTFVRGAVVSLVAVALCACAVILAGPDRFASAGFTGQTYVLLIVMLALGLPLQLLGAVVAGVLRGREYIAHIVVPRVVCAGVRIGLICVLVVGLGWGVAGAVFSDVFTAAAYLFMVGMIFAVALPRWPAAREEPSLGRMLGYGVQVQAWSVSYLLFTRLDLFLVNYYLSEAATGLYAVALTVADFATYPVAAVGAVLFPRLAALEGRARSEALLGVHRTMATGGLVWAGALAAAILLIPAVYGVAFSGAMVPAWICLGGALLWAQSRVLHQFFASEERQLLCTVANLSAAAVMVGLDILLIPRHGIVGAAVGYAAALAFMYLLSAMMLRYYWQLSVWPNMVMRRGDVRRLRSSLFGRNGDGG